MKTEINNLSANFRNLYGDMRGSKSKKNPCSDYVNEKKLIRKIKSLIDDDVILKLSKTKKLGVKEKTVKKKLLELIDYKIPKLNGKEIKNYIERVEGSNVYACIRKIIRERKQNILDKRRKRII